MDCLYDYIARTHLSLLQIIKLHTHTRVYYYSTVTALMLWLRISVFMLHPRHFPINVGPADLLCHHLVREEQCHHLDGLAHSPPHQHRPVGALKELGVLLRTIHTLTSSCLI